MANNSNSTQRGRSSSTTNASSKTRASAAKRDDNVALRAARTVRDRPYASAAIATGAVTAVAAAAAGAFFFSRRDKSFKEASGELATKVKDGVASATDTVKDGFASASDTVKDLGQRSADYFKGDGSSTSGDTRSQREIAEEALSLKETGATGNPAEALQATEIKAGAISY